MKRILLTGKKGAGKFVLVDSDDYEHVSQLKWFMNGDGYAARSEHVPPSPTRKHRVRAVRMHRYLLGALSGQHVDHVNGDRLDNRRANLRFCTQLENNHNVAPTIRNRSGYKGVSRHSHTTLWRATIKPENGKQIQLGYFKAAEEAALAYDAAAIQAYGDFAYLNIIGRS